MKQWNEAERSFYEDVREKKKAASGVHSKTGSRGYVGTMRFPTDIMSRKDKYNYRKAGKVMITNLMDEILVLDEFKDLDVAEQRKYLEYWRSKYTNKEIQAGMKLHNSGYYKLVADLDLPKAPRIDRNRNTPKRIGKAKTTAPAAKAKAVEVIEPEAAPVINIQAPEPEPLENGLHLIYNGIFSPEQIIKQLTKFELLLDGEPDNFYIELKLVQKEKKEG
jgi:hypothetical protein